MGRAVHLPEVPATGKTAHLHSDLCGNNFMLSVWSRHVREKAKRHGWEPCLLLSVAFCPVALLHVEASHVLETRGVRQRESSDNSRLCAGVDARGNVSAAVACRRTQIVAAVVQSAELHLVGIVRFGPAYLDGRGVAGGLDGSGSALRSNSRIRAARQCRSRQHRRAEIRRHWLIADAGGIVLRAEGHELERTCPIAFRHREVDGRRRVLILLSAIRRQVDAFLKTFSERAELQGVGLRLRTFVDCFHAAFSVVGSGVDNDRLPWDRVPHNHFIHHGVKVVGSGGRGGAGGRTRRRTWGRERRRTWVGGGGGFRGGATACGDQQGSDCKKHRDDGKFTAQGALTKSLRNSVSVMLRASKPVERKPPTTGRKPFLAGFTALQSSKRTRPGCRCRAEAAANRRVPYQARR